MNELNILIVFTAGLAAFFSPCTLPLIPVYFSYISGVGITAVKDNFDTALRKKILFNTIFFIAGFSAVFTLMEIAFIYFTNFISNYIDMTLIYKLMGVIIILMGIHFTGLIHIKALYKELRLNTGFNKISYPASFIIGAVFGFGWTPCMGPILASVIVYASNGATLFEGIIYLVLFSLGLGIPFVIAGFFMDKFLIFLKKTSRYMKIFEIISGVILIIMGLMLFMNKLELLSNLL